MIKVDMAIFDGLGLMSMVSVIAMVIVLIAMAVDLVSGVHKAKIRGEARTSYGLSRTLTKFLIYEGILLIAQCIDTLLHFGLHDIMEQSYNIPCVVILMAILLCCVELWSVYEKAEDKQRSRMAQVAAAGVQALDKDAIAGLLSELIRDYVKNENQKDNAAP